MTTTTPTTSPTLPAQRGDYGQAIRNALREAGVSVHEAADALGVSGSTMTRKLAGRSPIYVPELFYVAKMTGMDVVDLVRAAHRLVGANPGEP